MRGGNFCILNIDGEKYARNLKLQIELSNNVCHKNFILDVLEVLDPPLVANYIDDADDRQFSGAFLYLVAVRGGSRPYAAFEMSALQRHSPASYRYLPP